MGGHQAPGSVEPGGGWSWTTGEPWVFTAWASSEPSNDGFVEDAIHFFPADIATWNDFSRNDGVNGFVVEFE